MKFIVEKTGTPGLWRVTMSGLKGATLWKVSRKDLKAPEAKQELKRNAVYLLSQSATVDTEPSTVCYVGQARDGTKRLTQHLSLKATEEFMWDSALVVALDSRLSQDKDTIERLLIRDLRSRGATVRNKTAGNSSPHSLEDRESVARTAELVEKILLVAAFVGIAGEDSVKSKPKRARIHLLRERVGLANARVSMENGKEKVKVLKGSRVVKDPGVSTTQNVLQLRQRLLKQGILQDDGQFLVFKQDHAFPSRHQAAVLILGRSTNARNAWKRGEITIGEAQ